MIRDRVDGKYECWECGSKNVYAKCSGKRTALYCADCGRWVRWLTGNDLKHAYRAMKLRGLLPDGVAFKHIEQRQTKTLVRCSQCRCLLFDSSAVRPEGQFDLYEAYFCPKCGNPIDWIPTKFINKETGNA